VNAKRFWHAWSMNLLTRRPVTTLATKRIVEFIHQLETGSLDARYHQLGNPTKRHYYVRVLSMINQYDRDFAPVITVDGARGVNDR
jgi:hypothetical protein